MKSFRQLLGIDTSGYQIQVPPAPAPHRLCPWVRLAGAGHSLSLGSAGSPPHNVLSSLSLSPSLPLSLSSSVRWRCVFGSSGRHGSNDVGSGCCVGLVSLGMGWGLGEKVMKEKRVTTNVVARFRDALDGPPIPWVPPCVSPPQFPSRVSMCPPTSLWRGEGRVRLSSVLGSPGC